MTTSRLGVAAALAVAAVAGARPDFLAFPPGGFEPLGLSGDGRVAVGHVGNVPALWSAPTGVQLIDPGVLTNGYAIAASTDGSVIVGRVSLPGSSARAWRWTGAGTQVLGPIRGYDACEAVAVTGDGAMVIGSADTQVPEFALTFHPWRWTAAGGLAGVPLGVYESLRAVGASGDGGVIVGRISTYAPGVGVTWLDGFRWTPAGGVAALPTLAGHERTYPTAVSRNGQVIVGAAEGFGGDPEALVAVRWVGQPQALGSLSPHPSSRASGVSADGSVIVGWAGAGGVPESAWIRTDAAGMRDLKQVLAGLGVAGVAGWTLIEPHAVSDDGTVVAGRGRNGAGQEAGWIATLGGACYADCTGDGQLTIADFGCFQTAFVQGTPYADCTGDGVLTIADFGCFQTKFVQGCP